jgi:hypothetical protein
VSGLTGERLGGLYPIGLCANFTKDLVSGAAPCNMRTVASGSLPRFDSPCCGGQSFHALSAPERGESFMQALRNQKLLVVNPVTCAQPPWLAVHTPPRPECSGGVRHL